MSQEANYLLQNFLTGVCDHMAFQLIGRDEFFVACVAFKYFMYLKHKSKVKKDFCFNLRFKDDSLQWSGKSC